MVKSFKGIFSKIENMNNHTKLFTIDLDSEIDFKAGQFVNLIFYYEGQRIMKPYSIASNPNKKNQIELCINLVPEGKGTPHLFKMNGGDEIEVKGPLGLFKLSDTDLEKLVFIGTGTGIAPLRSMIYEALELDFEKEILLILGCRYENEILFEKEFDELNKKYPNFKFIKIVSRPSENWAGRMGYVQDNFDSIDVLNASTYICGLPKMVEASKVKLLELGMDEKNIHFERYV